MWLFSQRGFFSIVQYKDDPKKLMVKSRIKGDIEKYWPEAIVERNEDFDYLYRATLPRWLVTDVIRNMAEDINYSSFKGTLEDKMRYHWYVSIWEILVAMQEKYKLMEAVDVKEGQDGVL